MSRTTDFLSASAVYRASYGERLPAPSSIRFNRF